MITMTLWRRGCAPVLLALVNRQIYHAFLSSGAVASGGGGGGRVKKPTEEGVDGGDRKIHLKYRIMAGYRGAKGVVEGNGVVVEGMGSGGGGP